MKIYIDFDGVIFDTKTLLFGNDYKLAKLNPNFDKVKYVKDLNWYDMILKSEEINNSISFLKEFKNKIEILTKVNTLDNEATAKIKILRELGVESNIILVPFNLKKVDIVNAKNNILVDDTVHNLEEWETKKGIPIYFNKDNCDIDNWDNKNTKYEKITSLEYLRKYL